MQDIATRSEDPRAVRTRRAIKQAFFEMILETDVAKISVKDHTERAGINRKTFYLHFETIEQLYNEVVDDILADFFDHHETTEEIPEDFAGHATRFFRFLAVQTPAVERIVCARGAYDFGERLYFGQMHRYRHSGYDPFLWLDSHQHDLVLCFIRSTALDFYRRWVQQGKVVPVDDAALLLSELTCNGVQNLARGECPGV